MRKIFRRETGGDVRALDGVRSKCERAELTALVGPDGAGKTTLIRLMAGLLTADGGELRVLGIDPAVQPQQVQSRIGYMPQQFGLYEDLTRAGEPRPVCRPARRHAPRARGERYPQLMQMTDLGRSPATGRAAFGWDEAEARPGVHAGALAGAAAAR